MTIVVEAAKADGYMTNEAILRIRAMCALSPVPAGNTGDQGVGVLEFANNIIEQFGREAIRKSVVALPPPLRETPLAFACGMILADGVASTKEHEFIAELARGLRWLIR